MDFLERATSVDPQLQECIIVNNWLPNNSYIKIYNRIRGREKCACDDNRYKMRVFSEIVCDCGFERRVCTRKEAFIINNVQRLVLIAKQQINIYMPFVWNLLHDSKLSLPSSFRLVSLLTNLHRHNALLSLYAYSKISLSLKISSRHCLQFYPMSKSILDLSSLSEIRITIHHRVYNTWLPDYLFFDEQETKKSKM